VEEAKARERWYFFPTRSPPRAIERIFRQPDYQDPPLTSLRPFVPAALEVNRSRLVFTALTLFPSKAVIIILQRQATLHTLCSRLDRRKKEYSVPKQECSLIAFRGKAVAIDPEEPTKPNASAFVHFSGGAQTYRGKRQVALSVIKTDESERRGGKRRAGRRLSRLSLGR